MQIAVIGGGPAGLATAFHLTEAQRLDRLDREAVITVYEAAWRPGGKGASGRNPAMGHRIEEHGIHLFGAFYLNAFGMLRTCYQELCGAEHGLAHLDAEFLGNSVAMSRGEEDGSPKRWFGALPRSDGDPWDATAGFELDVGLLTGKLVRFARDTFARARVIDDRVEPDDDDHATTDGFLERLMDATRDAVLRADDRFRPALQGTEMFTAVIRGIVADDLRHAGIDSIDGVDHLVWLRRHGVSKETLASSMVEAIPAVCFQFPSGDSKFPASMSAAAFVATAVRQLLAPGEFNYFFRRGTGETVLLPLVLALRDRGVRFAYRHRLVDATLDQSSGSVEQLHFDAIAAGPRDGEEALIPIPGIEPPADHACRLGLGQAWASSPPPSDTPTERVTLTAGHDFDAVVLALPPAAFEGSCPSLRQLAGLDAQLPSVATVSAQLWLEPDSSSILPPADLHGTERLAGSDWIDPCNGWTDYSDLIAEEVWPSPAPGALVYFCGTVPDSPTPPAEVARRELHSLVDQVGSLFWGGDPSPVVDELYAGGVANPTPAQRIDAQYVRVNSVADERYVLAGPGTLCHRPRAWESPYRNLAFAGDWTRHGFNVSSFEGAVMSGALASYAVCGSPHPDDVLGYGLLRGDPAPGGRTDLPPDGWTPIV